MRTVDVDKGPTAHISHTGTTIDLVQVTGMDGHGGIAADITLVAAAIDVAANSDLGLRRCCSEDHQQTYYGVFNSQLSIVNYQLSIHRYCRIVQIMIRQDI